MAQLSEIVSYCDDLLQIVEYQDYCPNGLQVAGRPGLRRLVSGVSASQALLDAAVARKLLRARGIPSILGGETSAEMLPVLEVSLLVREEDADRAADILRNYFDKPGPKLVE